MKFTDNQIANFGLWQRKYEAWRRRPDRSMHELRAKPAGFDLWVQGANPLKLHVQRAWSNPLIAPEFVSDAKPIPLDHPEFSQQNLPL